LAVEAQEVLNTSALESGITECGLEVSRSKFAVLEVLYKKKSWAVRDRHVPCKILNFHLFSLMIKSIVWVLILILGRGSPNFMLVPNCYL
jgi:hypothetical protein